MAANEEENKAIENDNELSDDDNIRQSDHNNNSDVTEVCISLSNTLHIL